MYQNNATCMVYADYYKTKKFECKCIHYAIAVIITVIITVNIANTVYCLVTLTKA